MATAILGALYALAYVLILSDYRDADGFMDCWPSCTALQVAVAVVLWYGGLALVLGALGALVGLLAVELRRPRGRHSFRPWRESDRRAER